MNRAAWFLATACDKRRSLMERTAAWRCYQIESWYEACLYRQFPSRAVPEEFAEEVRRLLFDRNEGPLSGLRVRRSAKEIST